MPMPVTQETGEGRSGGVESWGTRPLPFRFTCSFPFVFLSQLSFALCIMTGRFGLEDHFTNKTPTFSFAPPWGDGEIKQNGRTWRGGGRGGGGGRRAGRGAGPGGGE